MNAIGIYFKDSDPMVIQAAQVLAKKLIIKKIKVIFLKAQAKFINKNFEAASPDEIAKSVKFIVALGGDGTVLRCSRLFAYHGIPVLGIHFGGLGFLTEVDLVDAMPAITKAISGKYEMDSRSMLGAKVTRGKNEIGKLIALNDISISKSGISRMLWFKVFSGKNLIADYAADGLIVSSPTGSTAHNLSAGGPLVHPTSSAIILTPICPHAFNNRPIVLTPDMLSTTIILSDTPKGQEVTLTSDGQEKIELKDGDVIEIKESEIKTKFIRIKPFDFFGRLRKKLGWGYRSSVKNLS